MDPVLIEVPERIETERLILRCPRPGDGPTVNDPPEARRLLALGIDGIITDAVDRFSPTPSGVFD